MKSFGSSLVKTLIDFFELAIIGFATLLFIYIFAGQPLRVTGDSMLPNFMDGEQIISEKISIKTNELKRGEVVIFDQPQDVSRLIIKRVIGLPGEKIRIQGGIIYINNAPLSEPYLSKDTITSGGNAIREGSEYQIPDNSYVLMGDNRTNSTDSREWGAIPANLIVGRAFLIYYPFNKFGIIPE